jgi:hypothetical protein
MMQSILLVNARRLYPFGSGGLLTGLVLLAAFGCTVGAPEALDAATTGETQQPLATPVYRINCGGDAVSPFSADQFATGGTNYTYPASTIISTKGVANAAPAAVYSSERFGNHSYTLSDLTPNGKYTARLHFSENYVTASGMRQFNVTINGARVLTNFDIYAQVGSNKALVRDFDISASGAGQITIQYANVIENAKSGGIEILTRGGQGGGGTGGGGATAGAGGSSAGTGAGGSSAGTGAGGSSAGTGAGGSSAGASGAAPVSGVSYSTSFDVNESPLSEGGRWKHQNIWFTTFVANGGNAYGTAPNPANAGKYEDSYAFLGGMGFSPNQYASAHVHKGATGGYLEVELLLRVSDSANSVRGYECFLHQSGAYAALARWRGAPLSGPAGIDYFDILGGVDNVATPRDGDLFEAQIVGNIVTAKLSGATLFTIDVSRFDGVVFPSGDPGIGFDAGASGAETPNSSFGFKDFFAKSL